jgi:NAD-dependent dihydropyrimidine dehydrogenase PreA subunit/nitroreductase
MMVVIDEEKCIACGLCVKICHEHCITLVDDVALIDDAFCSTCTQCVAICPERALSWDGVPPATYEPRRLPSPEQLDELLKERRTIRSFKRQAIERPLLEEVVSYGAYAPAHSYALRAVVADDEETLSLLDQAVMRFNARLYNLVFRPRVVGLLARWSGPTYESEYLKVKPKLERALASGQAYPSPPAAFVFLVGDRRVPLAAESAQYALYNMALYAQLKGLGCRNLVGNQMIFNRSRAVRARLGLHRRERIYGTLGLGYPAVKFRNKVQGRSMALCWVADKGNRI